jgi:hypothetical protein
MQFSPISRHSIPLRSTLHPVLKHPKSMFLPYCQGLIFSCFDSRREDRRFWAEW